MAQLSPLILMATEGLLNNTALQVVPTDTGSYTSQAIVADYLNTASVLQGIVPGVPVPGDLLQATVDDFITRLDDTAPYISNRNPSADGTAAVNYTTIINQHVDNLFPPGDPLNNQIFAQYALISIGVKETANAYVNSAVNSQSLTAQTFTSQDALMSGNITAVNTNIQAWGAELANTGFLFNVGRLETLGTPQGLVESLIHINMLTAIATELEDQGIDVFDLQKVVTDDLTKVLKPLSQKRCYTAFTQVTGDKLTEILNVMQFTVGGITTLADLLDLRLVFPTTYSTLTAPFAGELKNIYNGTNISADTDALVTDATASMPDDQAKANYAFSIALEQIKGISNTTPDKIAEAASAIETNNGLPNTGGLTEPLPPATAAVIVDEMGGGTGPDSTFYLSDFVGAPAAIPGNANFTTVNNNLTEVQGLGGFDDLALVLQIFRDIAGGVSTARVTFDDNFGGGPYTIEVLAGNPGAGFISSDPAQYDFDEAVNNYLPTLDAEVANYIAAYPTQHAAALDAYLDSTVSVIGAIKQLWDANVRFELTYVINYQTLDPNQNGLPPQKASTLAFAENLHQYGKKTDKGNIAEILEAMATATQGGDAIIAAMREGRNLDRLAEADVKGDSIISDQPTTVEPGNIS